MQVAIERTYYDFKDEVEKFVNEEIKPYAGNFDREQNLPRTIIDKLALKGYLSCTIPTRYGGSGLDNVSIAIINEVIGGACSSTRSLLTVHGMCSIGILRWANKEIKEEYLPKMATGEKIGAFALTEPLAGSDAKSINASAEIEGDYYVINGEKKWITMAQIADVFIVYAKCNGEITAFLLDRECKGLTIEPIKDLLGCRASMLGKLIMKDCKVPKNKMLGRIGTGISHVALNCLDYGRFSIACGCVGVAQACLEESIAYSRKRIQFGEPIKNNQLIRKMIAEMTVKIKAARLLCINAAKLKDEIDMDSIMETWTAKYYASTMLSKITKDALQIHGGNGICSDYNVERYYRDGIINEIIEGSTQIQELLISKNAYNVY